METNTFYIDDIHQRLEDIIDDKLISNLSDHSFKNREMRDRYRGETSYISNTRESKHCSS